MALVIALAALVLALLLAVAVNWNVRDLHRRVANLELTHYGHGRKSKRQGAR